MDRRVRGDSKTSSEYQIPQALPTGAVLRTGLPLRDGILTLLTETPARGMGLAVWRHTTMKKMFLTLVTAGLMVSTAAFAGEIHQRKENQQRRIGEGVENGSLTAGETRNLEGKEARLNHEIRRDRRQNGGNLTNKEKAQVNRQQNHLSRQIYRDKHNAAHQ